MRIRSLFLLLLLSECAWAQTDTTGISGKKMPLPDRQEERAYAINEVVVTGTRNETDIRHLPMSITIVNRKTIEESLQPSLLPILSEQVPGLFVTSRGIM